MKKTIGSARKTESAGNYRVNYLVVLKMLFDLKQSKCKLLWNGSEVGHHGRRSEMICDPLQECQRRWHDDIGRRRHAHDRPYLVGSGEKNGVVFILVRVLEEGMVVIDDGSLSPHSKVHTLMHKTNDDANSGL
ncbi:hypothetical protein VNO77_05526 [Canavalia gladiata]|uniref:Uncharacterized protein n=1 Tax=Canavalia gladiata TaxID=3824 RepID=A0AAN9MYH6_CANGL